MNNVFYGVNSLHYILSLGEPEILSFGKHNQTLAVHFQILATNFLLKMCLLRFPIKSIDQWKQTSNESIVLRPIIFRFFFF